MNEDVIKNVIICPMCGSEMKRDKSDSPHDLYTVKCTCTNHKCEYEDTICN